jgi:hypothetical protein
MTKFFQIFFESLGIHIHEWCYINFGRIIFNDLEVRKCVKCNKIEVHVPDYGAGDFWTDNLNTILDDKELEFVKNVKL